MAETSRSKAAWQPVVRDDDALSVVAQQLCLLRFACAIALVLTVIVIEHGLGIDLPLLALAAVVGGLVLGNLIISLRLRSGRPVSAAELFAQMLFDVAALMALLYCSGGSGNPFVSFFLLPLIVVAVTLPGRFAFAMGAVTLACYSLLLFFHWPLPNHSFNLHVLGMWFNFVVSAGLILGIVLRMARRLRERDAALAAVREQVLRDEHIVALGSLAAGAAHDLATPLATMSVLARESELAADGQAELADNMRCLREQIDACKHTLTRLRSYDFDDRQASTLAADAFLNQTLDDWRRMRPSIAVDCQWQGPAPALQVDTALLQTLTNLINNAADASPSGMQIRGSLAADNLVIDIRDFGPGIAPAVATRAGKVPVTTKDDGHGVGLLLANATIERLGGHVTIRNHPTSGACTRISIPLQAVLPT